MMNKKRFTVWLLAAVCSLSAFLKAPLAAPAYTESVIETSRTASLTVRKMTQKNEAPVTGTALDTQTLPADALPLAGVTFSYLKVGSIGQKVIGGKLTVVYSDLNTDFKTFLSSNGQTLTGRPAEGGENDGKEYFTGKQLEEALNAVSARPAGTGTAPGEAAVSAFVRDKGTAMAATDQGGYTTASKLPLGLYLVAETGWKKPADGHETIGAPASPFLISLPMTNVAAIDGHEPGTVWQYDVYAYPKNSMIRITKALILDGNNGDGKTLGTAADVEIGDVVEQVITSEVPKLMEGRKNRVYRIKDTMDPGLSYDEVVSVTYGTGAWNDKANKTLVSRTDYTVTSANAQTFTVALTEAGLSKLDAVTEASRLYVRFKTYVNHKATIGPDTNKNTPSFTYATNRTDEMTIKGNKPSVITYEIDLTKKAALTSADLTKITFEVRSGGQKMTFIKEEAGVYHPITPDEDHINSGGVTGADSSAASGTALISPDQNGRLIIRGLDAVDYVLTEKATAQGLTLLAAPVTFSLKADDSLSGALKSATVAYGDREPVPIGDEAKLAEGIVPWTIDNAAAILVPKTGGAGGARYALAGGFLIALIAASAAVFTGKKRKTHA